MNAIPDEVLSAALSLPIGERKRIARTLLESIAGADSLDSDVAWGLEAQRRLEAYERGEMKSMPYDEAMRNVRASIKR